MGRKRRTSLLRRLLDEIENFIAYFEGKMERVEKGVMGETIRVDTPPQRGLHPQVVSILQELLGSVGDEKAKKKIGRKVTGKQQEDWRDRKMAKCAICGIEAEDVFEVTLPVRKVGNVGEMLKAKELENILVLDVPVTKLCAYCADLHGIKHPDPDVAEKVAYYTDLMKRAVPKLPEHVEKPEGSPKIDVDKVDPVLIEQMREFINLARKMEKLVGEWTEEEDREEEDED